MWNVRNVVRSFAARLKSPVNGQGVQTTKEGRSEIEDEYKHLWLTEIKGDAWHKRPAKNGRLLSSKTTTDRFGHRDSQKDRPEWDASQFPTNRSWAEAFGWGAVLGLYINILQARHESYVQNGCPIEHLKRIGYAQGWINGFRALSMPYTANKDPLIRSVLPVRDSVSSSEFGADEDTESSTDPSEDYFSRESENDRPVYTSEAAARFSLMRDNLQSTARDYVTELLNLLGKLPKSVISPQHSPKAAAQEEYNLALFNELGIGVKRNSDKALNHYMEAACLGHPEAIRNLVCLHKYVSVPSQPSIHRSSSSPTLSAASSGRFFDDPVPLSPDASIGKRSSHGKFWSSNSSGSDTDGDTSSSELSRSASFPDLPNLISCN